MTADQWIEVLKIVVPLLTAVVTTVGVVVSAFVLRRTNQTAKQVGVLAKSVDGIKDEIVQKTDRAARAEGELKGITETAPSVIEQAKALATPPRDPNARTRADDRRTSAPPDVDPSSHQ